MAAIQRRKKNKKNKNADQDFVQGEDPTADGGAVDLASKAPEEAKEEKVDDGAPKVKTKAEKEKEKKEKEKQRKKELVCIP